MKDGIFTRIHETGYNEPVYAVRTLYSGYDDFPDAIVLKFDRSLPRLMEELHAWEKENGVVSVNPGFPEKALSCAMADIDFPIENFSELNPVSAKKAGELFRASEDEDQVMPHEVRASVDADSGMLELVFEARDDYTRTAVCHISADELRMAAKAALKDGKKSAPRM